MYLMAEVGQAISPPIDHHMCSGVIRFKRDSGRLVFVGIMLGILARIDILCAKLEIILLAFAPFSSERSV